MRKANKKVIQKNPEKINALLIFGPSGSGKSTISGYISQDLNFLHYEADLWPNGDGIDANNLRKEWDIFNNAGNPRPLFDLLKDRAREANKKGVVLSLPSMIIDFNLMTNASKIGLRSIILYGTAAECIDSFLEREAILGRNLPPDHWVQNNRDTYSHMSLPDYKSYRVLAFGIGGRRSREEIIDEIKRKMLY